mmetsp:Transcript_44696/g.89261  ORF Transcript_44696/g.89261 Transcript_44696/m.89261 type:complete len:269 (+) Transcript_44696:219-1025(+)
MTPSTPRTRGKPSTPRRWRSTACARRRRTACRGSVSASCSMTASRSTGSARNGTLTAPPSPRLSRRVHHSLVLASPRRQRTRKPPRKLLHRQPRTWISWSGSSLVCHPTALMMPSLRRTRRTTCFRKCSTSRASALAARACSIARAPCRGSCHTMCTSERPGVSTLACRPCCSRCIDPGSRRPPRLNPCSLVSPTHDTLAMSASGCTRCRPFSQSTRRTTSLSHLIRRSRWCRLPTPTSASGARWTTSTCATTSCSPAWPWFGTKRTG